MGIIVSVNVKTKSSNFKDMLNFQIQSDSEVPASKQLFDQIQFAIASGQYPVNQRLPSTRQLAMITGLHRNTISKVYQNLEETGLVESVAGSGIYVKEQSRNPSGKALPTDTDLTIQKSIDNLLNLGFELTEIKDLFLEEIDWRIQCNQKIFVTVPRKSLNEGKVMKLELTEAINCPVDLITLEDLVKLCEEINFGTIVTNHYFIKEVCDLVPSDSFRIIPLDIYDYSEELDIIRKLPESACVGIVSLSESILEIAASIVNSQIGEKLLVLTAVPTNEAKLVSLIRTAHTIIVGPSSYDVVKSTISEVKQDLIRIPDLVRSNNFVDQKSIDNLRKQLSM